MRELGVRTLVAEEPVSIYESLAGKTMNKDDKQEKQETRSTDAPQQQTSAPPPPPDNAPDVTAELESVTSLAELEQRVRAFEGCDLKKTATNTVFARGRPDKGLMFIGEAPGNDEDLQGLPFVGKSGQLLDEALRWAGFDVPQDCYISNMIFWRPPGNRAPSMHEISACLPFVERHVALVKPRLLVFLGGVAAKTLLASSAGITTLRRGWHDYQPASLDAPIKTKALFHPAYLLRAPGQKRLFWRDILELRQEFEAVQSTSSTSSTS
ncbi:MAG: uracil-DNA glycosylase [Alphaproteobacteria bacterium GM202ARS2]|nr:uracil-DNA glycosylase [Alphaproteobacteria bacterium GM202ARS2]